LIGVGVDLVERERAARLVHRNADGLSRFLLPSEFSLLKKSHNKPLAFAFMFAAKEAASKSVGVSLTGPGSFRAFRIRKAGGRLEASWTAPAGRNVRFRLYPFLRKNLVGIIVHSYRTPSQRLVK
jgi:phosphopantetheine--protein transferase-like protein